MVTVEQRAAGAAARAEGEMAALGARYTAVLDEAIALRDAMQSEQDPLLRQSLDRQALLATDRVQLAAAQVVMETAAIEAARDSALHDLTGA